MNATSPVPEPAIIITDNPEVVRLFNQEQFPKEGADIIVPSIASVLARLADKGDNSSLFLTNKTSGFINMEYQAMLNGSPKLTLQLLEVSEFFETKLLRSATSNLLEQATQKDFQGELIAPTTNFYIAFGSGDDLRYWSSMHAYQLVGAETYSSFEDARTIELSFVSNTGLNEFSHKSLKRFINPSLLDSGLIAVADLFNTKNGEDPLPAKRVNNSSPEVKARRAFRTKNFPFYVATLDNLTDKFLQVLFNTTNVFILNYQPPYKFIEDETKRLNGTTLDIEEIYKELLALADQKPRSYIPFNFRRRLQVLKKVLEKFYATFNENLVLVESSDTGTGQSQLTIQQNSDKNLALNTYKQLKNWGVQLNTSKEKGKEKQEIDDILESILTGYGEIFNSNDYVMLRENDLKILETLDEAVKADFGESQFVPTKPLIILGPKELISNYIFGQEYDLKDKISIFSKTSEPVKKHVELRTKRIFDLYGSQTVNKTTLAKLLADKTSALNNIIKKRNLPVFRYNTQNANVISMTVNDNRAYLNLLSQSYALLSEYASVKTTTYRDPAGFTDQFIEAAINDLTDLEETEKAIRNGSRKITKRVEEDLKALRREKQELVDKLLQEKASAFSGKLAAASDEERAELLLDLAEDKSGDYLLRNVISKTFTGQSAANSAETNKIVNSLRDSKLSDEQKFNLINSDQGLNDELLAIEAKAFENTVREKHGLVSVVEGIYKNDPVKFFVDQMSVIDQATFQVEIETLPYFPISTLAYMQIPCILFATRPGLVGVNTPKNPLDSVTGAYNILGFYHKIDTSKSYSKFKLFSIPSIKEI